MACLVIASIHPAGPHLVRVLRVEGELDAHTYTESFQDRLEESLADPCPRVVIDCSELAYIASAGLGLLKRMAIEMGEKGGDVRLAAPSEKITGIVTRLGFNRVLKIFRTVEAAVASFAPPAPPAAGR
jgi:anti-anti-sigma factor